MKSVQAVIYDNKEKEYLLIKRRGYNDTKYLWRLVKGRIENNEDEVNALKREVNEETGLEKIDIIKKIWEYYYTSKEYGKTHVSSFLVFANSKQKLEKKDVNEDIKDYKWVNYKNAIKMLFFEEEKECIKKAEELNHTPIS
ncbi:MAG: NUDIX domain-containing protein [Candidatus Aenigmatarchaeota archaeon]|nr:NUDIX domain-containing protein [Candidatus Aenigmarchaeota archaeon]